MKKNTSKWVIGIIIVVVIFVVAMLNQGVRPFAIGDGFSALSLGQQTFISNDANVGGQAWLLTVSQNGAGQYASGTFTATDSNAKSNSFTLSLSLDKNYATYPIYNQNIPVVRYDYTTSIFNPFGALGGCNPDVYTNVYKSPLSLTVFCYKSTTDGYYGTIGSANINFQSTLTVSGSGGSDSCTISNNGQTSCTSKDGKFYASWVGSLVSGQSAPQPTDKQLIAIYNPTKGGWTTSSSNDYNSYSNLKSNLISCLDSTHSTTCFDNLNNAEKTLLSGTIFSSTGGNVAVSQGTQSNGQFVMTLPSQVQFPVITMRIKAQTIGINIPVGMPKINSVSSNIFQTGSNGIITVSVSNVGSASGSFDVSAVCTNGFSQQGNSLRVSSLNPSSSQTIYLPITGMTTSGTTSGTCTITARDVNNPSNSDTSSVQVSVSALAVCTAGDLRISGNTIQQCSDNSWKTIKTCLDTEVAQYDGTTPKCIVGSSSTGGFFSTLFSGIGSFFSNLFSGVLDFFTTLKYVIVIFLGVMSWLYSYDFLGGFSITKNNKVVRMIIGGLFGFAIGILAFVFIYGLVFWVILLVLGIYQFFKGKIDKLLGVHRK